MNDFTLIEIFEGCFISEDGKNYYTIRVGSLSDYGFKTIRHTACGSL